uniref:Small ribosomal subunit protein uS3c n=1 Tax=Chaetophoropsis polyrhiza TaxID=2079440 RepID=A0A6H1U5U7_9CHLO|nr:ribosomal protein S3 [Chaetophoropsis polyrhiza]QIZ74224.1 ribosomal protein S3 [Chaetophoropsis polyrhiza]
MGQKIHPYGYRVGITQPHSARWFANKYQYPQYVFEDFLLKQSLFKNLPIENLPRKRTEDKSETKLVQIKIERLIRNTIKVKLYVTSPENAQELFENIDFNNSKKNGLKSTKASSSPNLETKKQLNSFLLNIQKKTLHKKILQLQILKLKNLQSKLVMFKTLLNHGQTVDKTPRFSGKHVDSVLQASSNCGIINLNQRELNSLSVNSGIKPSALKLLSDLVTHKQKVLYLLTKFESSSTFYKTQLSKIKQLNLTGFTLLNKLSKVKFDKNKQMSDSTLSDSIKTELKKVLAKNVLRVRKLELQLDKNSKNVNISLTAQLATLSNFETQITQISKIIGTIAILRTKEKLTIKDPVTFAEFVKMFVQFSSKTSNTFVNNYFSNYCLLLGKNVKMSTSACNNILRKDYLVSLKHILKTEGNNFSTGKRLYNLSIALLNQRYKLNKVIELKLKTLMLKFTKTHDKSYICSIQQLNNSLKQNATFIKQLESWLTLLTKKFKNPPVTTTQLLRDRIYKIDCYVNKVEITPKLMASTETLLMNNNFIIVNYKILKQKLIAELLKLEKAQISSLSIWEIQLISQLNERFFNMDAQLTKIIYILQNRLLELKNQFYQHSEIKTNTEEQPSELQSDATILFSNSKELVVGSKTLRLKTALQNLLRTNYENSFIVLQTRRQVYNNIINRFGGKRRYNQILTKEKTWINPFSKFKNHQTSVTQQSLVKDKTKLIELLDSINQKIYQRKPIKSLETRKQKFFVKKAIKKRLKQYLLLMFMTTNTNLASLKTIYNVKTLSKLCENLTDLQTVPKISVIELVKVHQPKQYAVCLANFIVENLEKRFSFRSTMKKAAEQAMSTTNVKGIKIQISGRLNGAEIARTEWLRDGVVPLQTLRANIDYSYKTAKTIYGILGVKVWLFKEENKK